MQLCLLQCAGVFRAHRLICVHTQGSQPGMATHPGAKNMANNFFYFKYIYVYIHIYKLIIGEYLQMLMLLRLMSLEDKNNILKLSDCEKYLINLLIPIQI